MNYALSKTGDAEGDGMVLIITDLEELEFIRFAVQQQRQAGNRGRICGRVYGVLGLAVDEMRAWVDGDVSHG